MTEEKLQKIILKYYTSCNDLESRDGAINNWIKLCGQDFFSDEEPEVIHQYIARVLKPSQKSARSYKKNI
jgi:hypothetical protein